MSYIDGIQPISGPRAIQPSNAITASQAQSPMGEISDVVEISTTSILAARVHEIPDVRADLVARVKDEIAAGVYETEERIDVAIDRLMEDMYIEL